MKIGFFDSGIGGITVLQEALKALPKEDYLYFADTANVPYGTKKKEEVRDFVFKAVDHLVKEKADAIVIACNTATSVAIEDLRQHYTLPIIGMEPAVKPAVNITRKDKRVLACATPLTIQEEKLKHLLTKVDNDRIVDLCPLPELVTFAENREFEGDHIVRYLTGHLPMSSIERYGTVVLGCTHFIYYKETLKHLLPPSIQIVDGNKGTISNLRRTLEKLGPLGKGSGKVTFYDTNGMITDEKEIEMYQALLRRLR